MKKKNIIIIVSILLILLFLILKIAPKIDINSLFSQKDEILKVVLSHYVISSLIFIIIYTISVVLAIPIATMLSILGGFLFGFLPGILFIVTSTTMGSMLIFLTVRYLARDKFQKKYSTQMIKFNNELEQNGSNYLLSLRLLPLFPFTLVCILTGLSNFSLKKFLLPSVIGILPTTTIYCYIGYTGNIALNGNSFISKEIFISLTLLCLISLTPIFIKKIKKQKAKDSLDL